MSNKAIPHAAQAKVIVVGSCQTGKSPLIFTYVSGKFVDPGVTIGGAFMAKLAKIGNKYVKLKIWDTAGEERLITLLSMYLKDTDAVMVCFSVTDRGTFEDVKKYLDFARKESPPETYFLLIGTKCDITKDSLEYRKREVGYDEAEAFARDHDLVYVETSSKSNINVTEVFEMVAKEKLRRLGIDPEVFKTNFPDLISNKAIQSAPTAKVVVIGTSSSGKSPLIVRYITGKFPSELGGTIGGAFTAKLAKIGNKYLKMKVWDTSGAERFMSLISMYSKDADAVMVCFSVTYRGSFEEVKAYLDLARKESPPEAYFLLVGTKCDLQREGGGYHKREVEYDEAEDFARDNGLYYVETSSKEDINVNEAFEMVAREKFAKLGIDPDSPVMSDSENSEKI